MKTSILAAVYVLYFSVSGFSQVTLAWLKTIKSPSESGGAIATDKFNNSYAAAINGNTT